MALKTFVKVGGVNNLSDARYCAGMEVDLLGFCVDSEDNNFMPAETYNEMKEWLSGIGYVAEFGKDSRDLDNLSHIIENYKPDFVQVDVSNFDRVEGITTGIILSVNIEEAGNSLEAFKTFGQQIEYLLLEKQENTIGESDLTVASKLGAFGINVIIGFGVETDNVASLITTPGVKGISLKGGDEISPGLKDMDELADILEILEIDDLA